MRLRRRAKVALPVWTTTSSDVAPCRRCRSPQTLSDKPNPLYEFDNSHFG